MTNFSIPTPAELEMAAAELGLSVAALCRRADVSAELFYRWRNAGETRSGKVHSMTTRNLQKLLDALAREKANRGDAAQ